MLMVVSDVIVAGQDEEVVRHSPARMGSGDVNCDFPQVPPVKARCSVHMAGQATRASRTRFVVHSPQCPPTTPSGPTDLSPCCVLSESMAGRWAGLGVQGGGALSDSRRSLALDPADSRKSLGNRSRRSFAESAAPHSYRSFASGKSGDPTQVRALPCSCPSFS